MKLNIYSTFFCLFIFLNSYAQWTNQFSGTTNFLPSINFATPDTGYVIQNNGYVRKTVDGGVNWNLIGGQLYADKILFTSIDTGFAYGNELIFKTTDGGLIWASTLIDSIFAITSIQFPSPNIGYAIGYNLFMTGIDCTYIFKTVNAGNNWSKIYVTNSFTSIPSSIFFTDASTGYYGGGAGLYNSTNGGVSWVQQFSTAGNYEIESIHFPAKDTGYAVGGQGKILKTINGGINWIQQTNPNSDPLYSVCFTDTKNGWAAGGNGFNSGPIIKTTNGGTTWTLSASSSNTFSSAYFPSTNIGYACGSNGTIMKYNGLTGLTDEESNSFVSIYPNPTTGKFNINVQGEISIYNTLGEKIFQSSIIKQQATIDLSDKPKGIYFLKVHDGENVYTEKVILQ